DRLEVFGELREPERDAFGVLAPASLVQAGAAHGLAVGGQEPDADPFDSERLRGDLAQSAEHLRKRLIFLNGQPGHLQARKVGRSAECHGCGYWIGFWHLRSSTRDVIGAWIWRQKVYRARARRGYEKSASAEPC